MLKELTPIEALFGVPSRHDSLPVFGCSCFANIKYLTSKKQFKSIECTFIGYNLNHKGYKCLDLNGKL